MRGAKTEHPPLDIYIRQYLNDELSPSLEFPSIELIGYLFKYPISKENTNFSFNFVSNDLKSSIKCIIQDNCLSFEPLKIYKVKLRLFTFDFITIEKNQQSLDYNLILIIDSISIVNINNKIDFEKHNMFPLNINKEKSLTSLINDVFTKYIQRIINEYYILNPHYDFTAVNFISKSFDKKEKVYLFKMIQSVFNTNYQGILIKKKEGIKFPYDYMINIYDEEKEFKSIDWKNLLLNTPTMKSKEKEDGNPLQPVDLSIKDLSKELNKEKEIFLNRKSKRNESSIKEKKSVNSKKVKELITYYSDINKNIGNSSIKKYMVFKKYENIKIEN